MVVYYLICVARFINCFNSLLRGNRVNKASKIHADMIVNYDKEILAIKDKREICRQEIIKDVGPCKQCKNHHWPRCDEFID